MREGLDERGKFAKGNKLSPGRTPLEDAERLRRAYRELWDDETLDAWQAAMRRKIRKADLAASKDATERVAGKVADNLTVSGDMRIFVEYVEDKPADAQD